MQNSCYTKPSELNLIDEQDLMDYVANHVIDAFKIIETEKGSFNLIVNVTWKKGDCILITARKKPRRWANLNTLVKFIKTLNLPKPPIELILRGKCDASLNAAE